MTDTCKYCERPATQDGLCAKHFAFSIWLNNVNIDAMGIFLFFKKTIPKAFKSFKFGIPFFHKEILWEILRDAKGWTFSNRKIVIAAPRGSSKTTLISKGLVLFCVLFKLKQYIVIASKTGRAAQKNMRWLRNVLGSSIVIKLFGDIRPDIRGKREDDEIEGIWTKELVVLKNGVTIEAVGMGQQLRSSAEGEDVNRIDLFIADDCETDENTKTPDRRESNEVWFFETVLPSLDLETGTVVYINTLTHTESILSKLLKSNTWRKKFYQIQTLDDKGELQSIWKEKFSNSIIESIKEDYKLVGRLRSFYKEYFNIIRTEAGFSEHWIRYYVGSVFHQGGRNWIKYKTNYEVETITTPAYMTLGIDFSYSYSNEANYTVLIPVATTHDYRKFIFPYSRGRYSTFDDINGQGQLERKGVIDEAIRLHRHYNFDIIVCDATGIQVGIFQQLKKAFANVEHPPRIIGYQASGDKLTRLKDFLQPEYELRRVHHLASMDELMRELLSFGDTTDDILDALFNALKFTKAPEHIDYDRILPPAELLKRIARESQVEKTNWMVL
jgi:hypothetical protein